MADWGRIDQAAGLRRLLGADQCPLVAFAATEALSGRAGLMLRSAATLARTQGNVVIFDEVAGNESISAHLRLRTGFDLFDVMAGDVSWVEALVEVMPGVYLLPAVRVARELSHGELGLAERLAECLREVRGQMAYALANCAMTREGLSLLGAHAPHLLVGVQPDGASITAAYSLLKKIAYSAPRNHAWLTVLNARSSAAAGAVFGNVRETVQRHLGMVMRPLPAREGTQGEDLGRSLAERFARAEESLIPRKPAPGAPSWQGTGRESVV